MKIKLLLVIISVIGTVKSYGQDGIEVIEGERSLSACGVTINQCEPEYIEYDYTKGYTVPFVLYSRAFEFVDEFKFSVGEARNRGINIIDATFRTEEEYFLQLSIPSGITDISPFIITASKDGENKFEYRVGFKVDEPFIEKVNYIQNGESREELDLSSAMNSDFELEVIGKNFYTSTQFIRNQSLIVDIPSESLTNEYMLINGQLLSSNFPYKNEIFLKNPLNDISGYFILSHLPPPPKINKNSSGLLSSNLFAGITNLIKISGSYLDSVTIRQIKKVSENSDYPDIIAFEKVDYDSNDSLLVYRITIAPFPSGVSYTKYRMIFENQVGKQDSAAFELEGNQSPIVVSNEESNDEEDDGFIYHNHLNTIVVRNKSNEETPYNNFENIEPNELSLFIDGDKIEKAHFTVEDRSTVKIQFEYSIINYSELPRSVQRVSTNSKIEIYSDNNRYSWLGSLNLIHKPIVLNTTPESLTIRPDDKVHIELNGFFLDRIEPSPNRFVSIKKLNSSIIDNSTVQYEIVSKEISSPSFESEIIFTDGTFIDLHIEIKGESWQDPTQYALIQFGKESAISFSDLPNKEHSFKLNHGLRVQTNNLRINSDIQDQKFIYWIESNTEKLSTDSVIVNKQSSNANKLLKISNLNPWSDFKFCYKVPEGTAECTTIRPIASIPERFFVIPSLSTGVINFGKNPFETINNSGLVPGLGIGYQLNKYFGINLSMNHLASFQDSTSFSEDGMKLNQPIEYNAIRTGIGLSVGLVFKENLVFNIGYDLRKRDDRYEGDLFNDRLFILVSAGVSLNFGLSE